MIEKNLENLKFIINIFSIAQENKWIYKFLFDSE
jgi:hypothetical protein